MQQICCLNDNFAVQKTNVVRRKIAPPGCSVLKTKNKMSNAHVCDLCGASFANKYQIGPHKRLCWNQHQRVGAYSHFTGSSAEESSHSLDSLSESDEPEAAIALESDEQVVRVPRTPLFELSQREKKWGVVQVCGPSQRTMTHDVRLTYDYLPVNLYACLFVQLFFCSLTLLHASCLLAHCRCRRLGNVMFGPWRSCVLSNSGTHSKSYVINRQRLPIRC